MSGEHKVWPKSLEAQLNLGSEGDFVGLVGYSLKGPDERTETMDHEQFGKLIFLRKIEAAAKPPGEWNHMEIEIVGGEAGIRLNGRRVNRASNCEVVAGPILLTAENDAIQFRKVILEPLDK